MGRTAVEQAVMGDLPALNSTQHQPFQAGAACAKPAPTRRGGGPGDHWRIGHTGDSETSAPACTVGVARIGRITTSDSLTFVQSRNILCP
jgi:hypothetical protein